VNSTGTPWSRDQTLTQFPRVAVRQCLKKIQGVVFVLAPSFHCPVFCISVEEVLESDVGGNETALRARWGKHYSTEKRDTMSINKTTSSEIDFGLCAISNVMAKVNLFQVPCFISFVLFDAPTQGKHWSGTGVEVLRKLQGAAKSKGLLLCQVTPTLHETYWSRGFKDESLPGFIFLQTNNRFGAVRRVCLFHACFSLASHLCFACFSLVFCLLLTCVLHRFSASSADERLVALFMNGIHKRPVPLTREDVEKKSREEVVYYVLNNGMVYGMLYS